MKRLLLIGLVLGLGACANMLRWEGGARGERQSSTGLQGKAPPISSSGISRQSQAPLSADPTPVADGEYRVQQGDTLYSIAFRNHLDFRELARWNGVGSDFRISIGQLLRLTPPPRKPGQVAPVVVVAAPKPGAAGVTAEAYQPMPALPSGFEWTWPTRGSVLRGYQPGDGSKGLDIGGELGQPIFAAAPGRVVYSGNALKGYGELIIIKHDETHLSAYGYNRKRYVVEGDVVTAGQPIGELGLGPENKPLLHFEIRSRGKPVNPVGILPRQG